MELTFSEAIRNLLHMVSQGLLIPTMVILALCVAISLVTIGSIIAEFFTERRHYKVNMPDFLARIERAEPDEVADVVENSGLLYSQRYALQTLVRYQGLSEENQTNLAKRILASTEQRYNRKVSRTDTLSKISPMLGLMGTLIPLGPGIVALGQGQTQVLAGSLMIAFDTTVIGLVTAVVCFVISRIRRGWYEDYVVSMESALVSILEKGKEGGVESVEYLTEEELEDLVPAPMKSWLGRVVDDAKARRQAKKEAEGEGIEDEADGAGSGAKAVLATVKKTGKKLGGAVSRMPAALRKKKDAVAEESLIDSDEWDGSDEWDADEEDEG